MEYLDFELEVSVGQGPTYPVAVRSPTGETQATMRFPPGELQLENQLQALKIALLKSGAASSAPVAGSSRQTSRRCRTLGRPCSRRSSRGMCLASSI